VTMLLTMTMMCFRVDDGPDKKREVLESVMSCQVKTYMLDWMNINHLIRYTESAPLARYLW
jgi:hypothetical protein